MANLPLTGSQYWGAALNNYLRQINTDVTALKLRLDNFTVSASYSGSGWVESGYNIAPCTTGNYAGYVEALGDNTAVYELKYKTSDGSFNPTFLISGTLIFNNPKTGHSSSIAIPESQNMKISFGSGLTESDDLRMINQLKYDNNEYTVVERESLGINVLMPEDGYYPVYAIYNDKSGFIVALNTEQEFIFHENYVLLGIAMRSTETSTGTVSYFFARKTDSALKSIYETRKGNLEAFATIVNAAESTAKGLFKEVEGGLQVILGEAIIDYHSNGISNNPNPASEDDYDYKHPYDYKRFTASGRKCYITKAIKDDNKVDDNLLPFTTENLLLVNSQTLTVDNASFETSNIYGIYISSLGDIIIEVSNRVDSVHDVTGYTNDYIWDLNSDSNFRTGGLVFLGAFYHATSGWKFMQPAINSISPAFISSKAVENANLVNLPDVTYLTYPDGAVDQITPFRYNLIPPTVDSTYTKNHYLLTLNAGFTPTADTDSYGRYHIPVLPSSFYSPVISSESHQGIRLGGLLINAQDGEKAHNSILDLTATCTIDTTGRLHCYNKLISASNAQSHTASEIESYDNYLENVFIAGALTLKEGAGDLGSFQINRHLTNVNSISSKSNYFYIQSPKTGTNSYNLHLVNDIANNSDRSFTIAATTNIPDGGNLTLADLSLNASKLTLSANQLVLTSTQQIEVGNTLVFTSDVRCKDNIQALSEEVCVDTVKKLQPKSFTYKDTGIESLGVIAQELEELCPKYKDLLVKITSTAELSDKRTVAETKLLFILWKAVQYLLNKEA